MNIVICGETRKTNDDIRQFIFGFDKIPPFLLNPMSE